MEEFDFGRIGTVLEAVEEAVDEEEDKEGREGKTLL
jgi:hypothetical protein